MGRVHINVLAVPERVAKYLVRHAMAYHGLGRAPDPLFPRRLRWAYAAGIRGAADTLMEGEGSGNTADRGRPELVAPFSRVPWRPWLSGEPRRAQPRASSITAIPSRMRRAPSNAVCPKSHAGLTSFRSMPTRWGANMPMSFLT